MTWDARDAQRTTTARPQPEHRRAPGTPTTPVAVPSHQLADRMQDDLWSLDTERREVQDAYHAQGWWTPRDLQQWRHVMTRGIQAWEEPEGSP